MTFRRAAIALFLVGTMAAALGIPTRASYGARVTGDEPQYLITAQSLFSDRDLDVSDQVEERSYEPFHEITLDRQTEPWEDGREVSPHDPLLPALLALPVGLGGWVGAKAFLAAINGLLAVLLLAIAVKRMGLAVGSSSILVGLLVASAPFAVYGNQVYPEIVAALVVALALWVLLAPDGGGGPLLVAAVVALPWLSIKYAPVAGALALVELWRDVRTGRWRRFAIISGVLVAAGVVYVIAHVEWYGGVTPYASGDHFASTGEFSVVGTRVDLLGRSSRLIGLLVDRNFGLVPWQPLYLLTVPAAAYAARRRFPGSSPLLFVAVAGWLNATFVALTMHGWWWPGRQLVVVLPAVALIIVGWATRSVALQRSAAVLGSLGVVTHLWFAIEGAAGRLTWVVDFYETSAPAFTLLSRVLPDYAARGEGFWTLHGLWVLVALAGAAVLYRATGRARHAPERVPEFV